MGVMLWHGQDFTQSSFCICQRWCLLIVEARAVLERAAEFNRCGSREVVVMLCSCCFGRVLFKCRDLMSIGIYWHKFWPFFWVLFRAWIVTWAIAIRFWSILRVWITSLQTKGPFTCQWHGSQKDLESNHVSSVRACHQSHWGLVLVLLFVRARHTGHTHRIASYILLPKDLCIAWSVWWIRFV